MKQRFYEAGPKATKLLAWRLRKQQAERAIYKIKDPVTNKILNTLDGIQRAFETYYKSLYTQSDKTNRDTIEKFLNSLDLPSLGVEQNKVLTSRITLEEIDKAISSLNSNKTPGTDGFPPEWYKAMRKTLLPLLETCFNYILKEGALPPSWSEAFISVIPKEGKDRTDCSGCRPISVLNTDCKLYASILSKRLEAVMPFLIDEDQTGFIKHRQTHDNIRRALHTIHQIRKGKICSIMLSLDAEKAFDSVGWEFLFLVMNRFGFSKDFIRSIQTLYTSPTARIKVNGSLSNPISIQRGCRQGCPVSPLLFNLFIEPLAQAIRQETSLEGIYIGGEEYKISLYADDVLVTVKDPGSSVPLLMDILKTYGQYSGYVINMHKTQALIFHFTPTQELIDKYNFNWNSSHIKYLGINIPKNISSLYNINYNYINQKIRDDLTRWSPLTLDFGSRIRAVKMNILPRVLYLFLSLPVEIPLKQFREWDKHISRFIWNNKKPRVKYSTLQLQKEKGGLALPCLRDYYLSAQLRPLVNWCNPTYVAKWKSIETSLIDIPIQSLLSCSRDKDELSLSLNPGINFSLKVWREVVKRFQIQKEIKLLSWPAYDPDFTPASQDSRYKQWSQNGITAFCRIVTNWNLDSFQNLCQIYELDKTDFYRYLQLRSYFWKEVKGSNPKELSTLTTIFVDAYNSGNNKGIISRLWFFITE